MKCKNRIISVLCTVILAVSFLHLFFGKVVLAEDTVQETEKEETIKEETIKEETMKEETIKEETESTENLQQMEPAELSEPMEIVETAEESAALSEETEATDEDLESEDLELFIENGIEQMLYAAPVLGNQEMKKGQSVTYYCTGSEQTFTVPVSGLYQISCTGGSGGASGLGDEQGGKGGVTTGRIHLKRAEILHIFVGAKGADGGRASHGSGERNSAAYNGGGKGGWDESNLGRKGHYRTYGSGGGATDIRVKDGGLTDRIMAAGGGGGAAGRRDGTNAGSGQYISGACGEDGSNGSGGGGGGGGYRGGSRGNGGANYIDESRFENVSVSTFSGGGSGTACITLLQPYPSVTLSMQPEKYTSSNVILTAETDKNDAFPEKYICWKRMEDSIDQTDENIWTTEKSYEVSKNGMYQCLVRDQEGNVGDAQIKVDIIDRLLPQGRIAAETEEWTKDPVLLTVDAADAPASNENACSGIAVMGYQWAESAEWSEDKSHTAYHNGLYQCLVRDVAGNEESLQIKVTQIDVTAPEVTENRKEPWYEGNHEVEFTAEDLQPDGSPGCGVDKEPFSLDGITYQKSLCLVIEKETTLEVWVRDKLGNTACRQISIGKDKAGKGEGSKDREQQAGMILFEEIVTESKSKGNHIDNKNDGNVNSKKETTAKKTVGEAAIYAPEPLILPQEKKTAEKKTPVETKKQPPEKKIRIEKEKKKAGQLSRKEIIFYSVWLIVIICGLIWLLFSVLLEHVTVYRRDQKGIYRRIGCCTIVRRREYKQINLIPLIGKEEEGHYQIRFGKLFLLLFEKQKVLIRTCHGIELRNVQKMIELS